MINTEEFIKQERARVAKLFARKHKKGFATKQNFVDWYIDTLRSQSFCCYYCEVSIFDIRELIKRELLLTRKVKKPGVRGPVLEVDKKINRLGYGTENCALSCYYCNNDKSYTLDDGAYKKFFGPARKKYVEHLLSNVQK